MAKEKPNKWTRERSYWEENGGNIVLLVTAFFFLVLFVGGIVFTLVKPRVPGLSELFSDPKPPPRNPMDQKIQLAPGEQEIILFPTRPKTPPAGQKPPPPAQNR